MKGGKLDSEKDPKQKTKCLIESTLYAVMIGLCYEGSVAIPTCNVVKSSRSKLGTRTSADYGNATVPFYIHSPRGSTG